MTGPSVNTNGGIPMVHLCPMCEQAFPGQYEVFCTDCIPLADEIDAEMEAELTYRETCAAAYQRFLTDLRTIKNAHTQEASHG